MHGDGWKVLVGCLLLGCGSGDDDDASKPTSVTLTGTTACERYASLAKGLGCTPSDGCMVDATCENAAIAWIDCAAKDTRQCMCESDGDLNCEGSFKANEGPALCVAEHQVFDDCSGD